MKKMICLRTYMVLRLEVLKEISIDTNDYRADKHLNDIDPDLNYLFKDTCDYTYNTEDIKLNSSDGLTMVTFNIHSIK